jgi:restriction system protein
VAYEFPTLPMIPTFDQLLRPLLALAAEKKITRRTATEEMVSQFKLSQAESSQRTPSGSSTLIGNRCGWAMTFLTKAALISKVEKGTYAATESGKKYLISHPQVITHADLKLIPGWEEAWELGRQKRRERKGFVASDEASDVLSTSTPEEAISEGIKTLESDLRSRLLAAILDQSPEFFEKLVLQVLKAMGYGSGNEDSLKHVGQSGDEGIDGRINQDALGLDQICVQAKRYAVDRPIDRMSIQAFIGSLAGQGVTKGIFITTSYFKGTAEEFVTRGSATKVVLVDGEKLIDLMLRHRIGTRVKESYEVYEIDQNYFDEE